MLCLLLVLSLVWAYWIGHDGRSDLGRSWFRFWTTSPAHHLKNLDQLAGSSSKENRPVCGLCLVSLSWIGLWSGMGGWVPGG